MHRILVPTDFSNNALKAVGYAAEIAKKSGAVVHLLHVIEPSLNMANMQKDSSGKIVVKERKEKFDISLRAIADVYPQIKIVPYLAGGNVVTSILDYAEQEKIDLIVMGTEGASGLKRFFIGSVAAGAIGKTKIPILTIPASYEVHEPVDILFATNQFEKNKDLLKKIMAIPKLFFAAVHVVVFKDIEGDKNAELIYNAEQLNDYLKFLKEGFPGIAFKGELLEGKDFEITIEKYSNRNEVDVIVMVTYPKSFFEKLFSRSVTKKMAFHSAIPLLAIPGIS